jgi:homoserine kinase
MKSASILVYTTTANIGPGYDKLGAKLDFSPTRATATITEGTGLEVERTGNYDFPRPNLPEERSVASTAYRLLANDFPKINDVRIHLDLQGNIPPGGTGSSGADGVAVIELLNSLFDFMDLSTYQKLAYARSAEDGNHIDNVLPGIVGGISALTSPLDSDNITYDKIADPGFACGLLIPRGLKKESGTSGARSALITPEIDRLEQLTSGLKSGDFAQVSAAMREYDQHPSSVTSQRNQQGIYGIGIARLSNIVDSTFPESVVMTPSGSGPTMFFMGTNENDVADAMDIIVIEYGIEGHEAQGHVVEIREPPSLEDLIAA